jgi:hypothetical protein
MSPPPRSKDEESKADATLAKRPTLPVVAVEGRNS